MTSPSGPFGFFEPSPGTDSVRSSPGEEGSNVCRAAALASLLQGATDAMQQLEEEQRSLGFSQTVVAQSGRDWRSQNLLAGLDSGPLRPGDDLDAARVQQWNDLNETNNPRSAVAFLIAMLGSPLEREATAAAAALWRGLDLLSPPDLAFAPDANAQFSFPYPDLDFYRTRLWRHASQFDRDWPYADVSSPYVWQSVYRALANNLGFDIETDRTILAVLAGRRLDAALRSPDPVTRSLAFAASLGTEDQARLGPPPKQVLSPQRTVPRISTMIHGTWGWKGNWWRPDGEFHHFVRRRYRPNLYSGGARFSWSGAYSESQRALAARDFVDWASEMAPDGLRTVFGHSYGGEIACRASSTGDPVEELALLSTPVTGHVDLVAAAGMRIIDVRLRFDPVLAIAGTRQRIANQVNVSEVLLRRWRLDHSATHYRDVWEDEEVAARGGIQKESDLIHP